MWRTAAFGILSCSVSYFKNAVIKRRVLQGGKLSLSIPWNLQSVNQNLYLDIMTAFMPKVRKERSQPALLERDREIRATVNQIVIRTVVPYKLLDCKDSATQTPALFGHKEIL
jgi:hypothetical protein